MKEKERLENFSPIGCDADGNVLIRNKDYHWILEEAEKAERYEEAIEEALELMKHGGHGTRSKVWNVLKKALEVNEQ
ncbi:hypothetical protein [Parageobacillus thermoglucosidasius]|uniref:hypothetical protein n=1 Tax=Parageobacillus thermoglucosidasius TaxID=1426 RepID=UPI0001D17354|nr:hypothetical protein [Parageobacillus thermoglucosidasius]AEH46751.1 hypothetical protein Geoth_0753 [Parageobacillus thermoglucosidasius C56-YS93]